MIHTISRIYSSKHMAECIDPTMSKCLRHGKPPSCRGMLPAREGGVSRMRCEVYQAKLISNRQNILFFFPLKFKAIMTIETIYAFSICCHILFVVQLSFRRGKMRSCHKARTYPFGTAPLSPNWDYSSWSNRLPIPF